MKQVPDMGLRTIAQRAFAGVQQMIQQRQGIRMAELQIDDEMPAPTSMGPLRHQLQHHNLADGFELVGLGELADATQTATRVVQF